MTQGRTTVVHVAHNHAVAGSTPAPATTISPATCGASFRGRPGSRAVPANFEPTEPARRSRRLAAMPCPARPRRDLGIFRVNGGRGMIYEREARPVATVGRYVVKPIGHVCCGSHERDDAPPKAMVRRVPRQQVHLPRSPISSCRCAGDCPPPPASRSGTSAQPENGRRETFNRKP